jgi:hypothetical protein
VGVGAANGLSHDWQPTLKRARKGRSASASIRGNFNGGKGIIFLSLAYAAHTTAFFLLAV